MSKEPSPIEKTMTRAQLFLCNSPLWTLSLRPDAIKTILNTHRKLKNTITPNTTVQILTEAVTDYGVIDNRRLKEILKKNLY